MFPALLTSFFFALSGVCGKRTAEIFGSLAGNFWRLVVATIGLGVTTWLVEPASFATPSFLWFLFSGVIGFGIGDVGLYLAYSRIGSRLTILINFCLAPVFGAVVEFLWLGTKISGLEILAGLAVLTGVGMALLPSPGQKHRYHHLAAGAAFAVLAGFGQGFGAVISRQAEQVAQNLQIEIGGISAAFQRVLGGVVIAWIAHLAAKRFNHRVRKPAGGAIAPRAVSTKSALSWLFGAALFGPVIGVSCFQWALKETPSALVLSVVATTPIVLIPMAYLLENDVPTRKSLIGAVIAVAGVIGICLLRSAS